jgi:hypothetical protein
MVLKKIVYLSYMDVHNRFGFFSGGVYWTSSLFLGIAIPMVVLLFDTSLAIVRYWRFDFDLKIDFDCWLLELTFFRISVQGVRFRI